MKTQNKKAKILSQRSDKINKLFTDVEDKYQYCNLKAYARRMLQPMLNQQQEFIRQKYNKQYGAAIAPSFPWQNVEDSPNVNTINPQVNEEEDKSVANNSHYQKKLKRAIRKRPNYSLNDVIQKEAEQGQKIFVQTDEQVSDDENKRQEQYEEYRGCSMRHSIKQVQQQVTFYERELKRDLKSLPKLQQENNLIRRITSSELITQQIKKARQDSQHRIQQYLIEDYKKHSEEQKLNESNISSNQDDSRSSTPSNSNYKKILPDIFKMQEDEIVQDTPQTRGQRQYSNFRQQYDLEQKQLARNQQKIPSLEETNNCQSEQYEKKKKKNSVLFSEQDDLSNRSNSQSRMRGGIREKQSTCVTRQNEDTFQSIQRSDYCLDTTLNHSKIHQSHHEDIDQDKTLDKTPLKKQINFEKMHKIFQLNRVVNPVKFFPKGSDESKNRDLSLKSHSTTNKDKEIVKFPQKSFSRNSSQMNLIGGSTTNNSYISNCSQDQIIQKGMSSPLQLQSCLSSQKKKFLDTYGLNQSHSIPQSISQAHLKKRYNLPQEPKVPEFVNKMRDLILEMEQIGDNPLTGDQITQLANVLGLISIQKDTINYTGKSVVDYQFDMSKEHFIVPQKSRDNQINLTRSNQIPAYGSIAMLDKLYLVNLPSVYINQGAGRQLDHIK